MCYHRPLTSNVQTGHSIGQCHHTASHSHSFTLPFYLTIIYNRCYLPVLVLPHAIIPK